MAALEAEDGRAVFGTDTGSLKCGQRGKRVWGFPLLRAAKRFAAPFA